MRLITPYAPGSFLKPCIIVSTIYTSSEKETALKFVEALNVDHALKIMDEEKASKWVKIKRHKTKEAAVKFHLKLADKFINGGSREEWDEGWKPYLKLYDKWCPKKK